MLNRNDLTLPTQPNTPLHTLPITRSYTKTTNPLQTLPKNLHFHEVLHKATSPQPKQSETPPHTSPIKRRYTEMTFPLPRQSEILNPDYDQHRDYPSTANVTKHTFPTHRKVLQPEISHTSHMTWIYTYVNSQLPTLQDTPPQLIKCYTDMTTLLSTLQEISTTSPFTWNYIETNTSQPTQTETYHTSHLTEATQRLPFND